MSRVLGLIALMVVVVAAVGVYTSAKVRAAHPSLPLLPMLRWHRRRASRRLCLLEAVSGARSQSLSG
jgi:hypothetical protein